MPRAKPNEVIIHRIELGSWERDHISAVLATQAVKNIAEPTVALVSDISAMSIILGGIAGYLGIPFILGKYEDVIELIDDFKGQIIASSQYQTWTAAVQLGFETASPLPNVLDRWLFQMLGGFGNENGNGGGGGGGF